MAQVTPSSEEHILVCLKAFCSNPVEARLRCIHCGGTSACLIFPSLRAKGTKSPAANMLVADYLRVAAKKLAACLRRAPSDSTLSEGRSLRSWSR
jgi:hypothetical protein